MKFPKFIYRIYGFFETIKGWAETIKWLAQVASAFADFVTTIPAPPGYSEWKQSKDIPEPDGGQSAPDGVPDSSEGGNDPVSH